MSKMHKNESDLVHKKCSPCHGDAPHLTETMVAHYLKQLNGWALVGCAIEKQFQFEDYYETISFVNAVAWIAHKENHHPDITLGYKTCLVRLITHKINGVSENDFILAAKIDQLMAS